MLLCLFHGITKCFKNKPTVNLLLHVMYTVHFTCMNNVCMCEMKCSILIGLRSPLVECNLLKMCHGTDRWGDQFIIWIIPVSFVNVFNSFRFDFSYEKFARKKQQKNKGLISQKVSVFGQRSKKHWTSSASMFFSYWHHRLILISILASSTLAVAKQQFCLQQTTRPMTQVVRINREVTPPTTAAVCLVVRISSMSLTTPIKSSLAPPMSVSPPIDDSVLLGTSETWILY